MESEEIKKHFRQETRSKKKAIPDRESRQEISTIRSQIEEFAKHEDFESFNKLLERLVKDVDRRRVAVAQFFQMVSDYKKK
jgi:hypothetical protein